MMLYTVLHQYNTVCPYSFEYVRH